MVTRYEVSAGRPGGTRWLLKWVVVAALSAVLAIVVLAILYADGALI